MITQQQPRPGWAFCILVALVALALLGACQSRPPEGGVGEPGWRVVERSGEAHFQPPRSGSWLPVAAGEVLPGGSRVATGRGGRLIVARGADMVMVGPAGDLVLPEGPDQLRQGAGELRYRVAGGSGSPLRVATAQMALEASGAVFDIAAGADHARVRVIEGRLRVVSPDGARALALDAGDEAVASRDAPWLVRRNGEAHAAAPPPDRVVRAAGFLQPPDAGSAGPSDPTPATPELPEAGLDHLEVPLAVVAIPAPAGPAREAMAGDPRKIGFERLTAGLLDGLPAQRIKARRRPP